MIPRFLPPAAALALLVLAPTARPRQAADPIPPSAPGNPPDVTYREEDWQFLWYLNQEALVPAPAPDVPITDDRRRAAVPALIAASHDGDARTRAAALMALAKCGDAAVLPELRAGADDTVLETRRTALLALGVLGDPAALEILRAHLEDSKVEGELKIAAAIGLGLLLPADELEKSADGAAPPTPARDLFLRLLEPKAFLALDGQTQRGVALGAALTRDAGIAPAVAALLKKKPRKLGSLERAYLILALGKLQDRNQAKLLFDALKDDDVQARRSAALALGGLFAGTSDVEAVRRLIRQEDGEADAVARNFMVFALGWIGGSSAVRRLAEEAFGPSGGSINPVTKAPRIRLSARNSAAFAALGIGVARPAQFRPSLERLFTRENDRLLQAAIGLGVGLFGDPASVPALKKEFESTKDQRFRGYVGLALGMTRSKAAASTLEHALREADDDELVPALARALALIDRAGTQALLVERIGATRGAGARPALIFALGRIGDGTAVEPLLAVLADDTEQSVVRAYAATALGDVLDRHSPRRMADLLTLFNYTVEPGLFRSLLSTL